MKSDTTSSWLLVEAQNLMSYKASVAQGSGRRTAMKSRPVHLIHVSSRPGVAYDLGPPSAAQVPFFHCKISLGQLLNYESNTSHELTVVEQHVTNVDKYMAITPMFRRISHPNFQPSGIPPRIADMIF